MQSRGGVNLRLQILEQGGYSGFRASMARLGELGGAIMDPHLKDIERGASPIYSETTVLCLMEPPAVFSARKAHHL